MTEEKPPAQKEEREDEEAKHSGARPHASPLVPSQL